MARSRRARARAMATYPSYLVDVLASEMLEQALHLALLLGLGRCPIADHLLLGTHVVDEIVNRLGEIRHGGGRGLARSGVTDRLLEALDRSPNLARGRRGPGAWITLGSQIAHRRRQPILELNVEAVLRLARL